MDLRGKRIKNIRRAAGLLAGLLIFTGITDVLNEMYVSRTDKWYRILWQYFYEEQGKIDTLYLGSSHVYCDINPKILDGMNQEHHFNLATPEQRPNGSYYLLREADRLNELSHVYLEMYYNLYFSDETFQAFSKNWSNTDYMRLSINKIAYMLSIGGADQYINILFPYSRYRKYLGDGEHLGSVLTKKKEDYSNYYFLEGEDVCREQGYRDSRRRFEDSSKIFGQGTVLEGFAMGGEREKYLCMIIEYCQERDIPITLFVSPMNDLQLISTQNYDSYSTEIKNFAAKYHVPFYDFNLAKEEYLPLQDSSYYRDIEHLNKWGADLFTPFLYEVLEGEGTDKEKYFYDSYEEKLKELPPTVYGVYYRNRESSEGQERIRIMRIASNRDTGMAYRITMTPKEGEPYMVQDFEQNKEFCVSREEKGVCTIEARTTDDPNRIQKMEINY